MRVVLLVSILVVAAPDRPDPRPKAPASPQTQILGDWQDRNNASYILRFRQTETDFCMNGVASPQDGLTANIIIDWTKSPVTIDFMPRSRGGKMMGILKMEGDRLTVAVNTGGGQRPADFSGQVGSPLLLHYVRVKK